MWLSNRWNQKLKRWRSLSEIDKKKAKFWQFYRSYRQATTMAISVVGFWKSKRKSLNIIWLLKHKMTYTISNINLLYFSLRNLLLFIKYKLNFWLLMCDIVKVIGIGLLAVTKLATYPICVHKGSDICQHPYFQWHKAPHKSSFFCSIISIKI